MRYEKAEMPTPGLYTTAGNDGLTENIHTVQEKPIFHKFRVEKRERTPYRTHSYLSGGAASANRGGEEAGCPPVFLRREIREEHAVALSLP